MRSPPCGESPGLSSREAPLRASLSWILVADADEAARRRLAARMVRWGLPAYATGRGDDALRAATVRCLVLAVIDVALQDMAGYELVTRLRAHDPRLPVVMTTADRRSETERLARQAGIVHYAVKPLDGRRLEAIVAKRLEPPTTENPARRSYSGPRRRA